MNQPMNAAAYFVCEECGDLFFGLDTFMDPVGHPCAETSDEEVTA